MIFNVALSLCVGTRTHKAASVRVVADVTCHESASPNAPDAHRQGKISVLPTPSARLNLFFGARTAPLPAASVIVLRAPVREIAPAMVYLPYWLELSALSTEARV